MSGSNGGTSYDTGNVGGKIGVERRGEEEKKGEGRRSERKGGEMRRSEGREGEGRGCKNS